MTSLEAERPAVPGFRLIPRSEITTNIEDKIFDIYEAGYRAVGLWIGAEMYHELTLPTTTDVALLELEDKIVACASMNKDRIGIIAVNPDSIYKSQGYSTALLLGLETVRPNAWVSISTDHEKAGGMIASATSPKSPLRIVSDKQVIQQLYSSEHTYVIHPRELTFRDVSYPFLRERLKRQGAQDVPEFFTAVVGANSLHGRHGLEHPQVVFKLRKAV